MTATTSSTRPAGPVDSPARADPRDALSVGSYLEPGVIVAGRYRVLRVIGAGAMGVVYLAERREDGERVALKLLRADLARDRMLAARLRREASAMRRVFHPNVVALLDEGEIEDLGPYLVMEYLEGEPLSARLASRTRLSPHDAVAITEDVLAALEAAHTVGVVHRDLKPENIFLVAQGRADTCAAEGPARERAKVLDFGISQILRDFTAADKLKLTRTGTVVGTPVYMAPEQALGDGGADHRVDVYAAGVALYEMLSGCVPHDGDNYNQVLAHALTFDPVPLASRNVALDQGLCDLVHRAIARDPRERFPSAGAFRAALCAWRESYEHRSVRSTEPAPPLLRGEVTPLASEAAPREIGVNEVTEVLRSSRGMTVPPPPVPRTSRAALALAGAACLAVLGLALPSAPASRRTGSALPRAGLAMVPRRAHLVLPTGTSAIEPSLPPLAPDLSEANRGSASRRQHPSLRMRAATPRLATPSVASHHTRLPASDSLPHRGHASRGPLPILVSNPYRHP